LEFNKRTIKQLEKQIQHLTRNLVNAEKQNYDLMTTLTNQAIIAVMEQETEKQILQ
jgi:hypothetical protein